MADYDIYVLEENAISISGGVVLDGVTQGSGVHLNGQTITLNSGAWAAVAITDDDDNFQDSDGSQRLDGPTDLNGTTFASNSVVEAEYGIIVSDGTNSWTLVGFNINNSSPAYGTIEGLAFIGGPGGFPPVGVTLTVTSTFEGPNFAAADYATPICMASGTRVLTPSGLVRVEDIAVGDPVVTRDHGVQIVRWHGARRVLAMDRFVPVRFDTGAIGNTGPLILSQQHKVLVEGWRAELLFGEAEVLVPAVHLLNDRDVRLMRGGHVTYHHLLLDAHAVIETEGVWSESLHLGDAAFRAMVPTAQAEIRALFPELQGAAPLAYPALKRAEAMLLAG